MALEGIVIGTLLAIVTSYQVVVNSDALGATSTSPFACRGCSSRC